MATTTSPPTFNRNDRFEDETDTSSVSGYDSEWTQVSGTEDDGDYPPLTTDSADRRLSRRSTDDTVDGDIWEGFVDENTHSSGNSEDEMLHDVVATLSDVERLEAEAQFDDAIAATHDQTVNEALNSSVIGTLRASRARSLPQSLQSSLMDSQSSRLRLSFPDPLTRTIVGNPTPYDQYESSQVNTIILKSETDTEDDIALSRDSSNFTDIGNASTPHVSKLFDEGMAHPPTIPPDVRPNLTLVLYGSASAPKWQIAERLIRLATGRSIRQLGELSNEHLYEIESDQLGDPLIFVQVLDRTLVKDLDFVEDCDGPSLAVVLLPSQLPTIIPNHSLYLPLISRPSFNLGDALSPLSSAFSAQVVRDSAYYAWERVDLPQEKTLSLDIERPNKVIDESELENINHVVLSKAFNTLIWGEKEKSDIRDLSYDSFHARYYTLTLVTAFLIAAFSIGARFFVEQPADLSPDATLYATEISSVVTAHATIESTTSSPVQSTLALSFSLQDYAVAVFQPSPASSGSVAAKSIPSTTSNGDSAEITTEGDGSTHDCAYTTKSPSWAELLMNQKDHILKPATSLSADNDQEILTPSAESTPPTTGSFDGNVDLAKQTSLSIRIRDSLAIIPGKNAVVEVVKRELRDVNDAVNELLVSVEKQVDRMRTEAKDGRERALGKFWARNKRASRNAKKLRRTGKRILTRVLNARA